MSVTIVEVKTAKDRSTFVRFPYQLNASRKNWLPTVYEEDLQFFNPESNAYFKGNDTALFLAYREKKVVGRIMALIHRKYNEEHSENTVRFAFFECIEHQPSANALFQAVADWGKTKGMDTLIGPFGFSDKDPQGLLIEGFDAGPVIASNCNAEYVVKLCQAAGFIPKFDLVVYDITVPDVVPPLYLRIEERLLKNPSFQIREFKSRKELKAYILPIFELTNLTFREIYGFQPVSKDEAMNFAKQYLPVLNPDFVKVVEKDGIPVAYVIGMPDISEGIKKAGGRLYPLGFLKILRSARQTKKLVLLLGAIRQEYRGIGLDALMGSRLIASAIRLGYKHIDSHLELEDNLAVRAEMERLGGKVYKRFRVFQRPL
jgi:hypothetical protein